ncbi:MAG: hypothetical protein D6797_00210, partial [Bdellovibrio sp.]
MNKAYLIMGVLFMALVGCKPASRSLMPPPEKTQRLNKASATPLLKELRPQLDVVFVLDNSRSMEGEIHSLQENIQKFIKGLEGQKGLV